MDFERRLVRNASIKEVLGLTWLLYARGVFSFETMPNLMTRFVLITEYSLTNEDFLHPLLFFSYWCFGIPVEFLNLGSGRLFAV